MYNYFYLLFLLSFCITNSSIAQSIEKNTAGESIVVYPDGSWRHFDADNNEDQRLMQLHLQEIEKQKVVDSNIKNTTPSAEEKSQFDTFGDVKEEPSSRYNLSELTRNAISEEDKTAKILENAIREKFKKESRYKVGKKNKNTSKAELNRLKTAFVNACDKEKIAQSNWKKASKESLAYQKIGLMSPENQTKALDKLNETNLNKENTNKASDLAKVETKQKIKKPKSSKKTSRQQAGKKSKKAKKEKTKIAKVKKQKKSKNKKSPEPIETVEPIFGKTPDSYKRLNATDDILINPPQADCTIAFEGKDDFSGKKRKDIAPQFFFGYTNKKLRYLYKEHEMIECSGHLSSLSGGLNFLSLEIVVHDEKAQQNYGIIEKGSVLSVRLVDGTTVQLINKKTNQGSYNRFEKKVVYTAQYLIGPNQEKAFEQMEIDKVRIVWSTGFEEYEVYETDFLMNQLACLRN